VQLVKMSTRIKEDSKKAEGQLGRMYKKYPKAIRAVGIIITTAVLFYSAENLGEGYKWGVIVLGIFALIISTFGIALIVELFGR